MNSIKFARTLVALLDAIAAAPEVEQLCARLNEAVELLDIFGQPTDGLAGLTLPHWFDSLVGEKVEGRPGVLSWGCVEFEPVALMIAGNAGAIDAWRRPVVPHRYYLATVMTVLQSVAVEVSADE